MNETQEWTTIIKPKDKLWSVDFKELWHYRDLTSLFVKRDIITQYKQTALGPLWFIIQPVMTVLMYMVVTLLSTTVVCSARSISPVLSSQWQTLFPTCCASAFSCRCS